LKCEESLRSSAVNFHGVFTPFISPRAKATVFAMA
jgi:hypothetical protein